MFVRVRHSPFVTSDNWVHKIFLYQDFVLWRRGGGGKETKIYFLAIFRNEITTILTPSTSEGGEWGRWGWSRFSF